MPRAGQVKPPSDERLSDRIAIGTLTRAFPPELVDEVVAATGRTERRHRLLPARVTVYFVLAMCLFFGQGYEEVMRLLVGGLEWAQRWTKTWETPTTAAISRARRRLGPAPLQALFDRVCRGLATEASVGAWYRGWRLTAVDGTVIDVADTPDNDAAFGRPGGGRGEGKGAFPQVRVVGLAECGTHAITGAAIGGYTTSEVALTRTLLDRLSADRLGPGMLLIADRLFFSFDLWQKAAATGADLLWRVKADLVLAVAEVFDDGSYRSEVFAAADRCRVNPIAVRVIEYTGNDPDGKTVHYRLLTTILDPDQAPAEELAVLYAQRWEFETALDELKTHQRGPRAVLRSRSAEGVEQEVWAFLLVHWAVRELMHTVAVDAGVDPDRLSFTRSLRVIRRQVTDQAAFSP
ncbi:MAG: IS4 family transposase [Egibacteraceae bacterium]